MRIVIAGCSERSRGQMTRLLSSSGYRVYRVCSNAGELRRALNDCDDGLLILAGQMRDCGADEICWDYGKLVQILLVAKPPELESCRESGVFRLALPTSSQTVLGAVEMLCQMHRMRLPRRTADERELVDRAKALLMRRNGLTEPQAHRLIQQSAMNNGLRMADYARKIIKGDGGENHA